MGRELVLNSGPGLIIDQRRMLALVEPTLVRNPTGVDRVCEQPIKMPTRERFAAALGAIRCCAAFRPKPETVGFLLDPAHAAELTIQGKDAAHRLGLGRVDDECALVGVITERHIAAHPHALFLRGGDLVADAFAGDLALELGKGQQHIERQPPHRARRVELLRHRDERHSLGVEEFDQPGKIGERAGQPVDLVDDHDVDPAGSDIGDQVLQGGSLQIATGESAIVIAGSHQYPALAALAADKGLAGFALRCERVELLLQPFLGGFAGVDRAAPAVGVAQEHGDYTLMIDADEVLELPPGFRMPYLHADSYTIETGEHGHHWRPQLLRNGLPWRYEGVLHEFLSCSTEAGGGRVLPTQRSQKRLPGARIRTGNNGAGPRNPGSGHYRQEAGLLERALATEADPFLVARYKFYLAQTHLDAGDKEKALAAYRERATLGFWDQEVFISLYRSAGIEADLGFDEDAVIASYLLAHEAGKYRA